MSIFLEPEIEEGNIEYKRFLNNDENRLEEYMSQLKWRLGEGNGEAIYYLGIQNDGTFYYWSENEKLQSINMIKKLVNKANLRIAKLEKINYIEEKTKKKNNYFKVVIREIETLYAEKRILLLGPSGVGKSTFLANIILSKIDEEARMYLFTHKHEMVQKKTSSFSYTFLIYNNIKWVFIEAPGDDKYIKTRNRIILSFGSSIDGCLFFDLKLKQWEWKEYYIDFLNKMSIPFKNINLYETNEIIYPNYNAKILIDKKDFFMNLTLLINNKINKIIKDTEFIVLQSFINNDLGVILTGILKSGSLNIKNPFYLHLNEIHEIKINSIHLDGRPYNKISGPKTLSICINKLYNIKDYNGIISNKHLLKNNDFVIGDFNNKKIIYKDNKILNLESYKKYYQTIDNVFLLN